MATSRRCRACPPPRKPAATETRRRLERYVRDEVAAGRTGPEAVERLVAFKLLEARKLIRGAIDKHHNSNGYLFYLADHPDDEALHNAGDLPQDALGEGPRDWPTATSCCGRVRLAGRRSCARG